MNDVLGSFGREAAIELAERLSDPWTATTVVLGLLMAGAALYAAARLPGRRATAHTLARMTATVALSALIGTTFHWTSFLSGVWLVAVGALTLTSAEIRRNLVEPKRVARIYLPHWIDNFASTRNLDPLGLLSVTWGLALVGGDTPQVLLGALASLTVISRLVSSEFHLIRSGRSGEFAAPFWQVGSSALVLGGSMLAASTGAILDQRFSWIDATSPTSEGPLVIQAILGAEIAVASLSAAAVGLAIQLRSAAFGADVGFAQLHRKRITAAFLGLLVAALLTVFSIGQWNVIKGPEDGVLASLAVQAGIVVMLWLGLEATGAVLDLARGQRVAESIGSRALANEWQDQLRVYSWNADRPFSPAAYLPSSVHLLVQGVQGAIRASDLVLLEDIVSTWTNYAGTQPAIRQFDVFSHTADDLEQAIVAIQLSWEDADFLNGLDMALAKVLRNVAAIQDVNRYQLRAMAPLVSLTFPPFSKNRQHHQHRGFFLDTIPGFQSLHELTQAFQATHDEEAVIWILDHHWRRKVRLAIVWAERYTDEKELAGIRPRLQIGDQVFDRLLGYARNDVVGRLILDVILDGTCAAQSQAGIESGMKALGRAAVYCDPDATLNFWERLTNVVGNEKTDIRGAVHVIQKLVQASRTPKFPEVVDFDLVPFLKLCAAASNRVAGVYDEFQRERLSKDLAECSWRYLELRGPGRTAPLFVEWQMGLALQDFLLSAAPETVWKVADLWWTGAHQDPARWGPMALHFDQLWLPS